MSLGPNLLLRCIFKELVQNFILCMTLLLTIILIGKGLQREMRDLFMNLNLNAFDVLILISFMMPMFMVMILPISCMLSVFLTFLRMGTDRELIALKAGGIGLTRMLGAPLFFSTLCMFLALYVSMYATPWGMSNFRGAILQYASTKARVVLQPGVFSQNLFGKTIFAKKVDPITGRLHEVLFEDAFNDGQKTVTFLAPVGEIITDEKAGRLEFVLEHGNMYQLDKNRLSVLSFEEYRAVLNLDMFFSGVGLSDVKPKELSWERLLSIASTGAQDYETRKVMVELHKRLALPISCLVLGMLAMPVACFFEGSKRHQGIILAMVIFLVYYGIFSLGVSAGETGWLPAGVGMWLANALFAFLALGALCLSNAEKIPSFAIPRLMSSVFKKTRGNK